MNDKKCIDSSSGNDCTGSQLIKLVNEISPLEGTSVEERMKTKGIPKAKVLVCNIFNYIRNLSNYCLCVEMLKFELVL